MQSTPRRAPRGARLFSALLVGSLLVAACGNSGDKEGGDTTAATTVPGTTGGTDTTTAGTDATDTTTADSLVHLDGVPGVTDTDITYTVLGTGANNPTGACLLDCFANGVQAYFDWVNANGGVHGRQLVMKKVDDEFGNQQVKALEVVDKGDSFGVLLAGQFNSGFKDLDAAGVPSYTWMVGAPDAAGLTNMYPVPGGTHCIPCTNRPVAYGAKLTGGTKVGVVGYGVADASKQCVESVKADFDRFGADLGMSLVYTNDQLAFGLPNGVGPEVTAMKSAGVDALVSCIDLNGDKTIAQELERQGMGDVKMDHANMYDTTFIANAEGAFEGDIVNVSFVPFEAADAQPQLAPFLETMQKSGFELSELAMIGWLNAALAVEGLRAAGPEFDRAKVVAATNALTDFTAGGLTPALDWTKQHNPPTEDDLTNMPAQVCSAYVKVVGDGFELVGDPAKPFFCWPGTTRDWSEPTATSFG